MRLNSTSALLPTNFLVVTLAIGSPKCLILQNFILFKTQLPQLLKAFRHRLFLKLSLSRVLHQYSPQAHLELLLLAYLTAQANFGGAHLSCEVVVAVPSALLLAYLALAARRLNVGSLDRTLGPTVFLPCGLLRFWFGHVWGRLDD